MLVDINCDMGELPALAADGTQDALLDCVTSVNVSCGAHAGDEALVEATIRSAMAKGVAVGAHPGYPDPANFGRIEMAMSAEALAAEIARQLHWFAGIAARCGCTVVHVKPHGALYNVAAVKADVAEAIAKGIKAWRRDVVVMGLARNPMLDVYCSHGFRVWAEGFADRAYEADGTLRSRKLPGSLLTDPEEAAAQARRLATRGDVDTICIHSDTPGSVDIARAVARILG